MTPIDMSAPLALRPEKINELSALIRGGEASATKQDQDGLPVQVTGGIAVIRVAGFLVSRPSWLTSLGLATSTLQVVQAARAAVANSKVKGMVLDCDSPGGTCVYCDEASGELASMVGAKPMVSVAFGQMCSACYWAGSAWPILSLPSSDVGSHGVWSAHVDESVALQDAGLKVTLVASTPEKIGGNPYSPLSPEALADMKARVMAIYDEFTNRLAKNRKTTVSVVKENYGRGAAVRGKQAKSKGMVDGLITSMSGVAGYLQRSGAFASTVISDFDATQDLLCAAGWSHLARPRPTPLPSRRGTGHGDPGTLSRLLDLKMRESQRN